MQGPISRIEIEEISLGRTRGAKKLFDGLTRAAVSAKWRIPFMVRGVTIVIRNRIAAPKSASQKSKKRDIQRLLTGLVARIFLSAIPFVPIRIKNVNIIHQVLFQITLGISCPPSRCLYGHTSSDFTFSALRTS